MGPAFKDELLASAAGVPLRRPRVKPSPTRVNLHDGRGNGDRQRLQWHGSGEQMLARLTAVVQIGFYDDHDSDVIGDLRDNCPWTANRLQFDEGAAAAGRAQGARDEGI